MAAKRKTRFYARWRIDQDYLRRLSPQDRAWIERFNDEYYRAEFGEDPLHPPGEKRREIYDAQNVAARDLVTASSVDVSEAITTTVAERASLRARFYTPGDYRMFTPPGLFLEDELATLIDLTLTAKVFAIPTFYLPPGRRRRRAS